MDWIGYGPWMEGIGLQFTSVMWSMPLQEIRDYMDEDNMLNMLIDPYHPFSSPMVSNNISSVHGRPSQPCISIREGGRPSIGDLKGTVGPFRRMKAGRAMQTKLY